MRARNANTVILAVLGIVLLSLTVTFSVDAETFASPTSEVTIAVSTWVPATADLSGELLPPPAICEGGDCPTTCKGHWMYYEHQHGCGGSDHTNMQNHPSCTWLAYGCLVDHDVCGLD